jgi:hypothetical protein
VKFSFIAKHRGIWAVDWMCEAGDCVDCAVVSARHRSHHARHRARKACSGSSENFFTQSRSCDV